MFIMPPIFSIFNTRRLKQSVETYSIEKNWNIVGEDKFVMKVDLPFEARSLLKKPKGILKYSLVKEFSQSDLEMFDDSAFLLGRIGDYLSVKLNDCVLGKVSEVDDKESLVLWSWGRLKIFEIKKDCVEEKNLLNLEFLSFSTMPQGPFAGPFALVSKEKYFDAIEINDWLRFKLIFVFGFLLAAIGLYFFYTYLLVPNNLRYKKFSALCFSVSVFALLTSTIPYRLFKFIDYFMLVNFFSAIASTYFLISFFEHVFETEMKKEKTAFAIISMIFFLVALKSFDFSNISLIYKNWYPLFLVLIFIMLIKLKLKSSHVVFKKNYQYYFGACVLFLCCIVDVFSSISKIDLPYLISYGFCFLLGSSALSLAKEYADAFLRVEEQVAERTADLSSAMDELRSMDRMKQRLFANVSHDLKTPIAIAMGAIENATASLGASLAPTFKPVKKSLDRLESMVLEILDNAKAESGELKLSWSNVPVQDTFSQWLEEYKVLCKTNGIKLITDIGNIPGLKVPMDNAKMRRVIENLLSNAIKFTKRNQNEVRNSAENIIRFEIKTDASKLYFSVDDSGIGIPDSEKPKVFDRYFQSSRTSLKEHGGSGIGLSYVKEMIEMHNGKIYVQDSDLGGTRMQVELPLSQDVELTGEVEELFSGDQRKKRKRSMDVPYPDELPRITDPSLPNLLIAEDNPDLAQIVCSVTSDRYNVYFAENGQKALDHLNQLSDVEFHCALLDIEMPMLSGDQLVDKIRNHEKYNTLPIVMLSSHGEEEMIVKLLEIGANDYVQKPFRREILFSRLQAQISAHRGARWRTKLEKLQELGQLVSGIGHQGKNRISRVGGNYKGLIKVAMAAADKAAAVDENFASDSRRKIQVMGDLVDKGYHQTLDLFNAIDRYASGSTKMTKIILAEVFHDTLTLLEDKLTEHGIEIDNQIPQDLFFEGHNEFREAILNIVSNAIDVLEGIDNPTITLRAYEKSEKVFVEIQDNGPGIDKQDMERIFEAFYTNKEVGKGTGLGLYLARDAIELKNHGELKVVSEGQGAIFRIVVPKIVPQHVQKRPEMHNVRV